MSGTVAGLWETVNAEEDRTQRRGGTKKKKKKKRQAASPFPSKSGLRPKVLLSSRRRSPGCEGYTESRFAPTYRVGPVATFHLTVPTLTLQRGQERSPLRERAGKVTNAHAENRHRSEHPLHVPAYVRVLFHSAPLRSVQLSRHQPSPSLRLPVSAFHRGAIGPRVRAYQRRLAARHAHVHRGRVTRGASP